MGYAAAAMMQLPAMRRARSVSFPIPACRNSAEATLVKRPGIWARRANLVIQHRIFYSIIDGLLFLKSELQSSDAKESRNRSFRFCLDFV